MDARPTPIRFESRAMVTERTKVIYDPAASVARFALYARTERERRFVRAWMECEKKERER